MAPDVNWTHLKNVASDKVTMEDDEMLDEAVEIIKELEPKDYKDNLERCYVVIGATQKYLEYHEQNMEELLQGQDNALAAKERHIKELEEQFMKFQSSVEEAEQIGDLNQAQAENRRLIEAVEMLNAQIEDLRRDNEQLQAEQHQAEGEASELARVNSKLKADVKNLNDQVRDYQEVLRQQTDKKFEAQSGTDEETKMKLKKKNEQISSLLSQLTNFEERNSQLEERSKRMEKEMTKGRQELEEMIEEYEKMKIEIQTTDEQHQLLKDENNDLQFQLDELRAKMRDKAGEDERFAEAVNEKVAEWKEKMKARDDVILDQTREINTMKDKLQHLTGVVQRGSQSHLVSDMTLKKIESKDREIERLQSELRQATAELLEHTQVIEDMKPGGLGAGGSGVDRKLRQECERLQGEVAKLKERLKDAERERKDAETDAKDNDERLSEALRRVAQLESGQYGLTEAVGEIREWKETCREKEQQIQKLTQQFNVAHDKMNDILEENEDFRERLGLEPRTLDDLKVLKNNRFLRQQQFRSENQVLLREIERLEEERIELKQQIRRAAQTHTQRAASDGLTSDDLQIIDDFIDRLKKSKGRPGEAWRAPDVTFLAIERANAEVVQVKEAQRKVASENEALRAAMNDVLLEVKQECKPTVREALDHHSVEKLMKLLQQRPAAAPRHVESASDYYLPQVDNRRDEEMFRQSLRTKVRRENDMLRSALLQVFAELHSVQDAASVGEALKLPALVNFSKVLQKRYQHTSTHDAGLAVENKRIKSALKDIYESLRGMDQLPTLDQALRLPAVRKLVNSVEEDQRDDSSIDEEIRESFMRVIESMIGEQPVPTIEKLDQSPQVVKLYQLLEKAPKKDDVAGENKLIKSSLLQILEHLRKSDKLPTLEQALRLPHVAQLQRLLEERDFEKGLASDEAQSPRSSQLREALDEILVSIHSAQSNPDPKELLEIPKVARLFKHSSGDELQVAMKEILELLRHSQHTPSMKRIHNLPHVSRILKKSAGKERRLNEENVQLRGAVKDVLRMIEQQSRDSLGKDDRVEQLMRLPNVYSFIRSSTTTTAASGNNEERVQQAMIELVKALREAPGSNGSTKQATKQLMQLPVIKRLFVNTQHSSESLEADDRAGGWSDEVTGSVRELRHQLHVMSGERSRLDRENYRLEQEVRKLSEQANRTEAAFDERTKSMSVVALPKSRDLSSDDVINALNEQLVMTLNDASKRESRVEELQRSLDDSRRQLELLRHQNHLLYDEHLQARSKLEQEANRTREECFKLRAQVDDLQLKSHEFDDLVKSLRNDNEDERKVKFAEASRKMALLRVNEQALIRHNKASEESEASLRRENSKLRGEMGEMERAVVERIGYLERYKSVAAHKISILQKAMGSSVSESDLELVNRRFADLTAKYRNLLHKDRETHHKSLLIDELQEEAKLLREEAQAVKSELKMEKEKRILLEETCQNEDKGGGGKSSHPASSSSANMTTMKKLAVLEMKELNERQRAEHATRMYHKLKDSIDQLQARNDELEDKFAQLTKLNLKAQQTEQELRDELASVVPKQVAEDERQKLQAAKHRILKFELKVSQLEESHEIATSQLKHVMQRQRSRENELRSLREQVRTFQVKSDDNAIMGKLHREILVLQDADIDAKRKVEQLEREVEKLRAKSMRLEAEIDGSENAVYLVRSEANNKCRQLRKTIEGLRRQFTGSIPLAQLEKFTNSMDRLREDKARVYEELRKVKQAREVVEDKLAKADVERQGLIEVKQALKENRTGEKIGEWCKKMDRLRLTDLKLQRQVVRQGEQIKYLEALNRKHEQTIGSLEEDMVQLLQAQENHQIEWESREADLERMLEELQRKQQQLNVKAVRMDDLVESLPDPTKKLDAQLTDAVATIKQQSKTVQDLKVRCKMLDNELERLRDERFSIQNEVMTRDKIINDLRLKLPYTATAYDLAPPPTEMKGEQLRMARDQIKSLNERLKLKEENVQVVISQLEAARRQLEEMKLAAQHQIEQFERKLEQVRSEAGREVASARLSASQIVQPAPPQPPRTSASDGDERQKVGELEDFVKEQDAAISSLMERIRAANSEIIQLKNEAAAMRRQHSSPDPQADKENRMEESEKKDKLILALKNKLAQKHKQVLKHEQEMSELRNELTQSQGQLRSSKEKSPIGVLKQYVSNLKGQLTDKQKQLAAMNRAMSELRADLVGQAQENLRAAAADQQDKELARELVEKKTKEAREQCDKLLHKNAHLQAQVKQLQENEANLQRELKKALREAEHKSLEIRRYQASKHHKKCAPPPSSGSQKYAEEDEIEPTKLSLDDLANPDTDSDDEVFTPKPPSPKPPSSAGRVVQRKTIYADTRVQVTQLKTENKKLKERVEELNKQLEGVVGKPLQLDKNALEVAKWETKKQFQAKLDAAKSKISERESTIAALEKQVNSLRETVKRLEKQRLRFKTPTVKEEVEQLNKQIEELREENRVLKSAGGGVVSEDRETLKHLEEQNNILQRSLKELYKDQHFGKEGGESAAEMREMEERLLKMTSDHRKLQMEMQQLKKDLPVYKDRTSERERLIGSTRGGHRRSDDHDEVPVRLGASLKSNQAEVDRQKKVKELEARVVMLKNVVERVERENEQLRNAPGVVSNQHFDKLKRENEQLKVRVHEVTYQMGGKLSGRYESKVKSVDKLVQENNAMRKELDREKVALERLRDNRNKLQLTKEKLARELEETKKKLVVAESKAPKISGVGHKGYQSAITAKMLENKLRKAEREMERKSQALENMKRKAEDNLKDYDDIQEENNKLKEQIEILERFPPGAGNCDPDIVKELQITRLSLARVENENNELKHAITILKRKLDPSDEADDRPVQHEEEVRRQESETRKDSELIRMEAAIRVGEEENERLREENRKLQLDVSHFGEDFFEEIEDLKYNYSEAVKKNLIYENQLRVFSQQFGFPVDLPPSEDE